MIHINIEVPNMGEYTIETLTEELKAYALKLISKRQKENTENKEIKYTEKVQRLMDLSKDIHVSEEQINEDERLKYLLRQ